MSDPMEDEKLIAILEKAVDLYSSDCEPASAAVHMMLDAIRSAGYRIVKPDEPDKCVFEVRADEGYGTLMGVAWADGPRREAIGLALHYASQYDQDGETAFRELIRIPVSRASLLAELESMKEAGE